jgi:hypothetical protein
VGRWWTVFHSELCCSWGFGCCFLGLLFGSEDDGRMFLWNVSAVLLDCTASCLRREHCERKMFWMHKRGPDCLLARDCHVDRHPVHDFWLPSWAVLAYKAMLICINDEYWNTVDVFIRFCHVPGVGYVNYNGIHSLKITTTQITVTGNRSVLAAS